MAITITTVNPPATVTPIAWDWQGVQANDPHGPQAVVTFAAGLATGTRADGVATTAPTYTITGVSGLVAPGGAQANGVKLASLAAGVPLTVSGNGTSGATAKTGVATTGGTGTGLTVDLIATGGVVTGAKVAAPGTGYAVGDVVTIAKATAGTGTDVTLVV